MTVVPSLGPHSKGTFSSTDLGPQTAARHANRQVHGTFVCQTRQWCALIITKLQTSSKVTQLSFASDHDALVALTEAGQLLVWDARSVAKWASAAAAQGASLPAQVTSASSDHAASPLRVTGATPFAAAAFFRSRAAAVSRLLITVEQGGGHTRVWDTSQNPWAEAWCVPESGCHARDAAVMLCSAVDEAEVAPDGPISAPGTFASAGTDGIVNVFDMQSRRHTLQLRLQVTPSCIEFAPGGHALLVGDTSGVVQALDSASMQPTAAVQMAQEGTPVRLLLAARVTASLRAAASDRRSSAASAAAAGHEVPSDRRSSAASGARYEAPAAASAPPPTSPPEAATPITPAPPSTIKYVPSTTPVHSSSAGATAAREQQRTTPAPTERGHKPSTNAQAPATSATHVSPASHASHTSAQKGGQGGSAPGGAGGTHSAPPSESRTPPPVPPVSAHVSTQQADELQRMVHSAMQDVTSALTSQLREAMKGATEAAADAAATAARDAVQSMAPVPASAPAMPTEVHHTTVQHEVFAAAADVQRSIGDAVRTEMSHMRTSVVNSLTSAVMAQLGDAVSSQVAAAAAEAAQRAVADSSKLLSTALQQSFVSLLRSQHEAAVQARAAAAAHSQELTALREEMRALKATIQGGAYIG